MVDRWLRDALGGEGARRTPCAGRERSAMSADRERTRWKDAGSARAGSTGATEDAGARHRLAPVGRDLLPSRSRATRRFAAAALATERTTTSPRERPGSRKSPINHLRERRVAQPLEEREHEADAAL